jgi:hypothetical protein
MRAGIGEEYRTLVRYFLGELPENERESVEERYMLDEAYAEQRDEVEMDLVDAYVGGTLTPSERRHFEQSYLVTRERREGVKAAYLSRVYRERIAQPAAPAPVASKIVFFPRRFMIPAAVATMVVFAIGGAGWLVWWGVQRQIRGVARMAANRPVRPPASPQRTGGGELATTPAPTHSKGGGGEVNAPQSSGPAMPSQAPTIAPQSPITPSDGDTLPNQPVAPSAAPPLVEAQPPRPAPRPSKKMEQEAPPTYVEPAPTPAPSPTEAREARATEQAMADATTRSTTAYPGDPAIQKKLESEYLVTRTTDDKSDIVSAGSVVVLHKDKVLMVAAASAANPCMNTYKDGKITAAKACSAGDRIRRIPGLGSRISADKAPATRNFVSGEKFWVTKIDVRANGVVLDFFTDATPAGDQGIRYKGVLTIPFGALTPTPEEALKAVAEVITVAPSDDKQPTARPPTAAPAEAAPAPIEPPPPRPGDSVAVSEGQTIDEVVAILGQPVRKARVGTKDIYLYKDLKVIFVNGKVKEVQ